MNEKLFKKGCGSDKGTCIRIGLVIAVTLLAACNSGCALMVRHQMKGRVPKINATVYNAEVNTIYGASGTLKETNILWTDGVKTVGTSDLRVTSPFGGFSEHIEGASYPLSQPAATK